jgi:hypothetical protein
VLDRVDGEVDVEVDVEIGPSQMLWWGFWRFRIASTVACLNQGKSRRRETAGGSQLRGEDGQPAVVSSAGCDGGGHVRADSVEGRGVALKGDSLGLGVGEVE